MRQIDLLEEFYLYESKNQHNLRPEGSLDHFNEKPFNDLNEHHRKTKKKTNENSKIYKKIINNPKNLDDINGTREKNMKAYEKFRRK